MRAGIDPDHRTIDAQLADESLAGFLSAGSGLKHGGYLRVVIAVFLDASF